MTPTPTKITFGEMRASGVSGDRLQTKRTAPILRPGAQAGRMLRTGGMRSARSTSASEAHEWAHVHCPAAQCSTHYPSPYQNYLRRNARKPLVLLQTILVNLDF